MFSELKINGGRALKSVEIVQIINTINIYNRYVHMLVDVNIQKI